MLHITLGFEQPVTDDDPLGREYFGYSHRMTDQELYETNRGVWILGARANRESYALFTYQGKVRLAVAIDDIVPAGTKRAIEGRILGPGDPVYDRYVGKDTPAKPARNPVTYFESDLDNRKCLCGCGSDSTRDFIQGHDQRAIHERIARIGTVPQFLTWFDTQVPVTGAEAS